VRTNIRLPPRIEALVPDPYQRISTALAFPSGQSGKSKNLHQPVGLISPLTTLQLRGRMKNEQTAQLNKPFGVL
jgi:hypothetical protein